MAIWNFAGLTAEPGQKVQGTVRLPGVDHEFHLTLIHGKDDGPGTLILGGIHGCEYTSIDAAIRLSESLNPEQVTGKIAVIPVVNIPAYRGRSVYVHPEDKRNLNRVFPGNADGTASERLAYAVTQHLIQPVDYLIDLHGGDMNEALVPFILYHVSKNKELNQSAAQFANAFGIRYVVAGGTSGSTYEAAAALGKVAVLAEAGQQGILDVKGSDLLVQGSLNALRTVGVVEGEPVQHADLVQLEDFIWCRSEHFGTWYPVVQVGNRVQRGDKVGELRDLFGNVLEKVFAPTAGAVLFCVTSLAINPGDPLLAVGASRRLSSYESL